MAEVYGEFYVDTTTGRQQVPQYDAWFKWTKFGINIASAVLAVGTILVEIGQNTLTRSWGITTFFVLASLLRVAEVAKERRDQARDADRIQKYCSSLILSPIVAGLAIALFVLNTAVLGGLITGIVCLSDTLMGLWVVFWDEYIKDFRRVRHRPAAADFDLDDALDFENGEGEQIGLTAMPAPLSTQTSSFTYGNTKAPGAGNGGADAAGGLRAGNAQKGKFNMANWEQPDEL